MKWLLIETEETQVSQHWKKKVNSIYLSLPPTKGREKKRKEKKKVQVPKYFTSWTSRSTAPTATTITQLHNPVLLPLIV